jgi:glutathione S-transferase
MTPPSVSHEAMPTEATSVTLVGRSSSVFTRVARIFAEELAVAYAFRVVPDLLSREPGDYGGNPALRLPVLETTQGAWFGALNICRQLRRLSTRPMAMAWPEDLASPLLANAQELTLQAMASEVTLIMNQLAGTGESEHRRKLEDSLLGTLGWLDRNLALAREALARDALPREVSPGGVVLDGELPGAHWLSYFEVTLFCLVTHLEFRSVVPTAGYPQLVEFCRDFGQRRSALDTPYRFDI